MGDVALRRLLGSCATGVVCPEHRPLRETLLSQVRDIDRLVPDAETNGIGPLVALHLGGIETLPELVRRGLLGLSARHAQAHQARISALEDAITALAAAGVRCLLLKGAALANLVYARPQLRAMRDVDLLLRDVDIPRAEEALEAAGFSERIAARPGRHEVVTRVRTLHGFGISIDLHRRLGLLTLPLYAAAPRQTFDELWDDSQPVTIGATTARALGKEDLLRFVFRHGFCLQLDEDRLRLVSIADAVTAMESWLGSLDWGQLRAHDPVAYRGLAMLHHVVPLSAGVLDALDYRPHRVPAGIADQYWGWPRVPRPIRGTSAWLVATMFPSEWWLRTRHGGRANVTGLVAGWTSHVRELSAIGRRVWTGAPRPER